MPDAMFLVSSANERDTDSFIETLGERLAKEVTDYITTYLNGARKTGSTHHNYLTKLSFVGHSLGGIIIREALKHLKRYQNYMHSYVSLGSPHLSYMYNSSSLINAGIWMIQKWNSSNSLKQLTMTDTAQKEDSYMFKLARDDGLKVFKYVMFVSSF